ncbi:MAG TPA: LptF/LptG family permease, partial [Candidatus Polarisedimenticolaceae bacterium]|nr:LptF/LptG family permease [Candidatus Polarisedimenticolaceae bacterium]
TAIKAAGFSMRRTTMPVLLITAMLCGLLYIVEDSVAPVSNRLAQETEDKIMGRAPRTYGPTVGGRWGLGPEGNTLYHYQLFDPQRREFQGLTVLSIDRHEPRIIDHLYAQKATWLGDKAELDNGWFRSFGDGTTPGAYEVFAGVREIQLEPPAQLVTKQLDSGRHSALGEQLSTRELKDEIAVLERRGYDTTRLEVAYHGKISRTMAPLVMVVLGLPFAFRVGRRGSLYGIGVALLLVLVYWAVFAVFNAMGLETLLDPWAAAWAPNILFGLLGSYLLLYIPT